jgi:hypothetical protein
MKKIPHRGRVTVMTFPGAKLLPGRHRVFLGMGQMLPGKPELFLGAFLLCGGGGFSWWFWLFCIFLFSYWFEVWVGFWRGLRIAGWPRWQVAATEGFLGLERIDARIIGGVEASHSEHGEG